MLASQLPKVAAALIVIGRYAFGDQDFGLKSAHELTEYGLTHLRTRTCLLPSDDRSIGQLLGERIVQLGERVQSITIGFTS
jgi:hypothetical protein